MPKFKKTKLPKPATKIGSGLKLVGVLVVSQVIGDLIGRELYKHLYKGALFAKKSAQSANPQTDLSPLFRFGRDHI